MTTILWVCALAGLAIIVGAIFLWRRGALTVDPDKAEAALGDFAGDSKRDAQKWWQKWRSK